MASSSSSTEKQMQDLDAAERNVFRILELAGATVTELQGIPACDMDKIGKLAEAYTTTVKDLRANLLSNAELMNSDQPAVGETKRDPYAGILSSLNELERSTKDRADTSAQASSSFTS
jgi:hypothetical protein